MNPGAVQTGTGIRRGLVPERADLWRDYTSHALSGTLP
jgi:hypothetical protein